MGNGSTKCLSVCLWVPPWAGSRAGATFCVERDVASSSSTSPTLLTPAFFARFPNVRFFIAGPDDGGRKAT